MNKEKEIFIYNIPGAEAMGIVMSETKEAALEKIKRQRHRFVNGDKMSNDEEIEIVSCKEQKEYAGSLLDDDDIVELIY